MNDFLIGIPAAILIAAVSSWITVQLALRRFRRERWWERKTDAYTKVIEALHNSKEFSDRHLEAAQAGREIPDDLLEPLNAERHNVLMGAEYNPTDLVMWTQDDDAESATESKEEE